LSERYEFVNADADITLYPPGTELGVEPIAGYAVVIGDPRAAALVVEDSLPSLAAFAERLLHQSGASRPPRRRTPTTRRRLRHGDPRGRCS
jgi:hypothetical protein